MGLQAVGIPDAVNGGGTDALRLAHGPHAPVRGRLRPRVQGGLNDPLHLGGRELRLPPPPCRVFVKAAVPPRSKRSRHTMTVGQLVAQLPGNAAVRRPVAAIRAIRDRNTNFCGVFRAAIQASRVRRCSPLTARGVAVSHMGHE